MDLVQKTEERLNNLLFSRPKELAQKFENASVKTEQQELKAVWCDDDDEIFDDIKHVDQNTKSLYKDNLKRKYETLIGTPSWARIEVKPEDDDESKLLRTVGHIKKQKSVSLPKDFLSYKKFSTVKTENGNRVNVIEFHPAASVMLIGDSSGRVALHSVGKDVDHLHTIKINSFPILSANFTASGNEVYLSSEYKREYCFYDLIKSENRLIRMPEGLKKPKSFILSRDGKYIAVADGFEEVFIISTQTNEHIKTLKHNSEVISLCFCYDSNKLYSFCKQGEVYIWNMSTFRVEKKFMDNGCIMASCIEASPCGRLLATGSKEGIVNVYETAKLNESNPAPLKIIQNLRTQITHLKFNSSSEILSLSSCTSLNAQKLVHLPSYHAFNNFPQQDYDYRNLTVSNFSPNSGFMSIGNNKGHAYLYRLSHYPNY